MTNPIAHPLVEDADAGELDGLVSLNAHRDGAAIIKLNRPVLNGQVAKALLQVCETLHGADHLRVVFIEGPARVFCRGLDKDWLKLASTDWTDADLRDEALSIVTALEAVTALPCLTVALIDGDAIGGGVALAACCDVAVATRGSWFAVREVVSGASGWLAAPFLVNAIGPRQAKALFATGRAFTAAQAEKIGLVQEVVEDREELKVAAERLVEQAFATAPGAVAESKKMVWEVWGQKQDHAFLKDIAHKFATSRFGEEGREGMEAIVAGRQPNWSAD